MTTPPDGPTIYWDDRIYNSPGWRVANVAYWVAQGARLNGWTEATTLKWLALFGEEVKPGRWLMKTEPLHVGICHVD